MVGTSHPNATEREFPMKKHLFLFLIALFAASAAAQDAMPTKEETVNYINKKSQEVVGQYLTPYLWGRVQFSKISFSLKGDKVELKYEGKGVQDDYGSCSTPLRSEVLWSYLFNPADLKEIVRVKAQKPNEPLHRLRLYFSAKTVRNSGYGEGRNGCGNSTYINMDRLVLNEDELDLPFFANDPTNEAKIRKALMHLRDLAKAEDDPFGN